MLLLKSVILRLVLPPPTTLLKGLKLLIFSACPPREQSAGVYGTSHAVLLFSIFITISGACPVSFILPGLNWDRFIITGGLINSDATFDVFNGAKSCEYTLILFMSARSAGMENDPLLDGETSTIHLKDEPLSYRLE